MTELSEKVLQDIKDNNIAPKPRWRFLLHDGLIAAATVVSVLVGSVAFSVMLYHIVNNDWEIMKLLPQTPLQYFFSTLPYVWLVVLVLFVGLAYYNARHTKGVYRYRAYWVLLASILVSILLGGVIYSAGLAPPIHSFFVDRLPVYNRIMHDRAHFWSQPEEGFLAGGITRIRPAEQYFELRDFGGTLWIVKIDELSMPPRITEGQVVRIIGELKSDSEQEYFQAEQVLLYHHGPGRRYFHPPHLNMQLQMRRI